MGNGKIQLPGCNYGTGKSLALESTAGNPIDNIQQIEIGEQERILLNTLGKKFPNASRRSQSTPLYNCHGLTFAARRTCVTERRVVDQILTEDNYKPVPPTEVLPGDILVYYSPTGDAEHSALVVQAPVIFGIATVISKWGKAGEFIHLANHCPYSFQNATYYRIQHEPKSAR